MSEIPIISGKPEIVSLWNDIVRKGRIEKEEWIKNLREQGFSAAHPNDGWVDRENNKIYFAYAHFNDGVQVGDKIMLGWAFDKPEKLRPVIITGIEHRLLTYYLFEDFNQPTVTQEVGCERANNINKRNRCNRFLFSSWVSRIYSLGFWRR